MSDVAVCIPVFGDRRYRLAGRQAVRSVLEHTGFDVFLGHDAGGPCSHVGTRVRSLLLPNGKAEESRGRRFLRKFRALEACLAAGKHPLVLALDADAIVVRPIDRRMIEEALDGRGLGMVEQTGIRGGGFGRPELRAHYESVVLAWFEAGGNAIAPSDFRYYNSGVVLATREKLLEIVAWVRERLADSSDDHQVGRNMIADQDYYQYWVHAVDPGCCAPLPWSWNHCRHWDDGFPRSDALILHFSSFCNAPRLRQIAQMALLRKGQTGLSRVLELAGGGV